MPIISALRRPRPEKQALQDSPGYKTTACFQKTETKSTGGLGCRVLAPWVGWAAELAWHVQFHPHHSVRESKCGLTHHLDNV